MIRGATEKTEMRNKRKKGVYRDKEYTKEKKLKEY